MKTQRLILLLGTICFAGVAEAADDSNVPERLQFTEKDLPAKDTSGTSEIEDFARHRGFDYATITRRAARGETKALRQFFSLAPEVDGAAAESYERTPTVVYHLLGDERFAKFLRAQPLAFQLMVRNTTLGEGLPGSARIYLPRYFHETAKLLFRKEIVDWFSPNGRYAVRKIFSDEFDLRGSKVERAELLEWSSGQVLCDLTKDDIGVGAEREGEILWSPDSGCFAYQSSDLTPLLGNLFDTPRPIPQRKQTVVYQRTGESFRRLDLSFDAAPGSESDVELKEAIPGHGFTEPVRWEKSNVLVLQRHEYYEKLEPITLDGSTFQSVKPFARLYRITATIAPDGKAAVIWKLRPDR